MKKRRREVALFGLSFLDVISCGFGAAVLLFMLVDHARIDRNLTDNSEMIARVNALDDRVLDDSHALLVLRAALDDDEDATETAAREGRRLRELIEQLRSELPQADDASTTRANNIEKLQQDLLALESRVAEMRAASKDASGDASRTVANEGKRQYLQGLDVSGRRILILVDSSASMLADTIVEAIRRRNMDDARKRSAAKWRRTVATADWITAQIDPGAQFQMIAFGEDARPLVGTGTAWLPAGGGQLDAAVNQLRKSVPGGGTNLSTAFAVAAGMSPRPDNIYLITDGLPTLSRRSSGGTVSGKERAGHFLDAVALLPDGLPVNVILLPMEGDPRATSFYWQLAQRTGGAMLVPSRDWP